MKLPTLLLLLLAALCATLLVVACLPEPAGTTGQQHPQFHTMRMSADHGHQPLPVLIAGWVFGMLQILLFTALLALGVHRRPLNRWAFGSSLVLTLTVFSALVFSSSRPPGLDDELFLALPSSTGWMFFAMWPAPLTFMLLYVVAFRKSIVTDEDLRIFEEMMARNRTSETTLE